MRATHAAITRLQLSLRIRSTHMVAGETALPVSHHVPHPQAADGGRKS